MRATELLSSPPSPLLPIARPRAPKLAVLRRRQHRGPSIRAAAAPADDKPNRNPQSQLHQTNPQPQHRRRGGDGGRAPDRAIGKCPEPPWLVLPPPVPENPFRDQHGDIDSLLAALRIRAASVDGAAAGVHLSQRLLQMKKWPDKQVQRQPSTAEDAAGVEEDDGPATRAVGALMAMFGGLQGFVFEGREGLDRVSRDCKDSLAWLFRRVYANSPNLVPLLLLTLSSYIATSTEMAATVVFTEEPAPSSTVIPTKVGEPAEEDDGERTGLRSDLGSSPSPTADNEFGRIPDQLPAVTGFKTWYDLGIKEGALDPWRIIQETPKDRRRRAYERLIAECDANSLVLSNYAQFLYTVAHDHDRAEHYFQCAAMAEPRDAEALSRYALFLWEERGDVSRAEELFLEAIELDPDNFHHSSSYAWFLWKTGAQDTCFLLSPTAAQQASTPPHESSTDMMM